MDNTPIPTTPEKLLVTVPAAAKMLSVSPRSVYHVVARGQIRLRHIGRSARIHVDDLRAYAASLAAQPVEERP